MPDDLNRIPGPLKDTGVVSSGGYHRPAGWLVDLFNVLAAYFILIMSVPVFIVITVLLWITQGRPIFYAGWRLGVDKKPFKMYKFRTLVENADAELQGKLLVSRPELITPLGHFLRNTRLDELPQLWNVIRRDMDMLGPRPVRREVYEMTCRDIPGYDRRFQVRPGLIGVSQLYTPHSAPKRLRSFIDNWLLQRKEHLSWNVYVLGLTLCVLLRTLFRHTMKAIYRCAICNRLLGWYEDKRRFERLHVTETSVHLRIESKEGHDYRRIGRLVNINEEAFLLRTQERDLPQYFPAIVRLDIDPVDTGFDRPKSKNAYCEAVVYRRSETEEGQWEYVMKYAPTTPMNEYYVRQYLLQESVV